MSVIRATGTGDLTGLVQGSVLSIALNTTSGAGSVTVTDGGGFLVTLGTEGGMNQIAFQGEDGYPFQAQLSVSAISGTGATVYVEYTT